MDGDVYDFSEGVVEGVWKILNTMGQMKDLGDYRALLLKRQVSHWKNSVRDFEMSRDFKNMHKCLIEYGIKEPYATNILHRIFSQAFEVIEKNRIVLWKDKLKG